MPKRIQLRRTRGWRMPAGAVKVDRTTKWGNAFVPGEPIGTSGALVKDREHAADLYCWAAPRNPYLVAAAREELAGRDLACWCGLCDQHRDGLPFDVTCIHCDHCHGDTLGRLANGLEPTL